MSEVKNIPRLRFFEFQGSWDKKTLGEIGEIVNGITYNPSQIQESGVLVLRSSNVQGGRLSFEDNVFITVEKYNPVKLNDILICVRNGSQRLIGKNAIINKEFDQVGFGAFMTVYRSDFNPFLQHWFQTEDYYKNVHKNLGATINSINGSDFKKFKVPFPKSNEQQKIADFLTAVDKRIELLEKKKTLLETYKKGVMKKIFNQEIRFKDDDGNDFPDWEEKRLGEISKITTGRLDANAMVDGGQYRFYTCAKDYYHIDNFSFDTDALIISGNGANVGYIHHYKGKFNAYQRTYVLDGFEESILYVKFFLDRYLKPRIESEKKEGNTPYIVKSTLEDMKIQLPTFLEQIKISEFLSSIDNKMELLESQIDKSKTWKKGLLQKMFV